MSISVMMASYNYGHFLPRAIEAIVNQSLLPKEFIIVDDASSDDSVNIIKGYQKQYPFIKLYQNEKNLGVIATANFGIQHARGDYVVCCSADDFVLPGFFEKSVSFLQDNPKIAICISKFCYFFGDNTDDFNLLGQLLSNDKCVFSPQEFVKKIGRKDVRLAGINTVFRRCCLLETDLLIPAFGPMSDWFLIYTLAFRYGVCFIPEFFAKLYIHPNAYSMRYAANKAFYTKTMEEMSRLLRTEKYADVRWAFIQSGIVAQLGIKTFPALLKHTEFLNHRALRYYLIAALHAIKGILNKFFPFLKGSRSKLNRLYGMLKIYLHLN